MRSLEKEELWQPYLVLSKDVKMMFFGGLLESWMISIWKMCTGIHRVTPAKTSNQNIRYAISNTDASIVDVTYILRKKRKREREEQTLARVSRSTTTPTDWSRCLFAETRLIEKRQPCTMSPRLKPVRV